MVEVIGTYYKWPVAAVALIPIVVVARRTEGLLKRAGMVEKVAATMAVLVGRMACAESISWAVLPVMERLIGGVCGRGEIKIQIYCRDKLITIIVTMIMILILIRSIYHLDLVQAATEILPAVAVVVIPVAAMVPAIMPAEVAAVT